LTKLRIQIKEHLKYNHNQNRGTLQPIDSNTNIDIYPN